MTYDESDLVDRMLRGDDRAFEAFVDEYYPRLYRFAHPRVDRDTATAEDVVQATLGKAISKLGSYRGEAALFSWLCSFCRFEISSLYRRRSRRPPELALHEESGAMRGVLESLAAGVTDPAEALEQKEVARLVRVALDALPLRYAHALEAKYLRGASVRDIARELGLTEKATESLLTRARRAFRDGFVSLTQEKGIAI